ncbi:putative methyltransferase YcgJ [Pseudovibrio sp. Ad46]|uniref:class I SAM-dependent methyltransferase n=1 Tax=Pseudovibrio sp. Ad46 TaxID=989432 RepID=UPI0007B28F07|nr:class I SAM-dependent methyltransferase [Pseudovibrio sp. Ad46]KZK93606.1 putative methyltransferase YcgJ [Pseudovibrio sp. Ad46]
MPSRITVKTNPVFVKQIDCNMSKPKEFWDKTAGNYDKTEERFEFIHRRVRKNAKKHLKDTDVVLDYGCGTGTTACELSSYVKEIHAIDISSRMVEIAEDKAITSNIENVNFAQGDIFDERYQQRSFDVILTFNMLHTVPDPQRVVQRILELLKPGGLFISVTPCLAGKMSFLVGLQILLMRVLLKTGIIPVPIRRLKSSDLDELVAAENFQIIDTENVYKGASSYFSVARKTTKSVAAAGK